MTHTSESWVGKQDAFKMSSMQGLPTPGSNVNVLISRIHLHPRCVLIEFWGKFGSDRCGEFECLTREIQFVEKSLKEFEGCPGDHCLVEVDGTWNRARIVSKNDYEYRVFLFDKGVTKWTTTHFLAWGKKEYFNLRPEVEFCVLANVLPLPTESKWSPRAIEFLKTLSGSAALAHVQDVLVPQRTFVLHIPIISQQMYEMGFAKKLSPDIFQDFVLMSLISACVAEMQPQNQPISKEAGVLDKHELFVRPNLPAGTVETVIVTQVTSPHKIFCQLKDFSTDLKNVSDKLTQYYEDQTIAYVVGPNMIGFPCATRGSDGRWYRSVLQQVFPNNGVVEVLNIDFGTKQLAELDNVRPLAPKFLKFPVVTYICSLYGIVNRGTEWKPCQIDFLRHLLLYKTVVAKFEYQNVSEGVHYVTLYDDDDKKNINSLFGLKENCLKECVKMHVDYALYIPGSSQEAQSQKIGLLTFGKTSEEKEHKYGNVELKKGVTPSAERLPAEDLLINSTHVATIPCVYSPSVFWIQTHNYSVELLEVMHCMYRLFKESENKEMVCNPTVGLFCAAKAEDGEFYRATVCEVGKMQIKVFLVDFGNTEYVERTDVRSLPEYLKKLPRLALKCSLAGVKPVDGEWSQSAIEFFTKAVTKKALKVRVIAKCDDNYVVRLTDPEAEREKDLSTLLCTWNLAEKTESKTKATQFTQDAFFNYSQVRPSDQHKNRTAPVIRKRKHPIFKEHMFSIGSVLDVSVSYIESPSDFWCHLVQSSGHLKMLMHDMQMYYDDSVFVPFRDTACVACHPDNRMWYRAFVIRKHETPHVDVLFVDYGQTETVPVYDLRRICPEFLTLPGQAFRCSLLNLTDPTATVSQWTDEAIARFYNFVENAASQFYILKCTIYAVMFNEQKIVFNIVDLETPFESICTSMVNLAKRSSSQPLISAPSFCLDSYYYSTHNVKTGTEEKMTVTCVNSVSQFHCHLERNADVIQDLRMKVNKLCHQLKNIKVPSVFGTLCFAKYTDGHWYRGQIKATIPAILVHFVDYGDTIQVDKRDLLPVPKEANDIMSIPAQALVCGLSDVPTNVPKEVNSWFEKFATESTFCALVVAREPDGKLLVELYHKSTLINSKIKTIFQIETKNPEKAPESSAEHEQNHRKYSSKLLPLFFNRTHDVKKTSNQNPEQQIISQMVPVNMNEHSAPKPSPPTRDGQKKALSVQLYIPPAKRKSCEKMLINMDNISESARIEATPTEEQPVKSSPPARDCKNTAELPKLTELPLKAISSGMEAEVYVSHYNSALSFYIQLVQEEDEIFSVYEKLNNPTSIQNQTGGISEVHPGDLIQAEYADDSSWYRAVVKEIHSNSMALVEFIDYGNTAIIPFSKMSRLDQSLLLLPMYSTHCTLRDVGEETLEMMLNFEEAVCGDGNKKFKCHFIRQSVGSVWEVSLEDNANVLTCLPSGPEMTLDQLEQEKKTPRQDTNESPLSSYCRQESPEMQQLKGYIATLNNNLSFWCQCADSKELDEIMSQISRVANTADHHPIDVGLLSTGNPCLALFPDDQQWYRAQVIDKNGNELSVFFVDYGNIAQVSITEVQEIPADLVEPPPQAFLCELEGFDSSCGCWASGAFEELSELTKDKLLELTVTKVQRGKNRLKYYVEIECEGQRISEKMRTWWNSSTTENNPEGKSLLQGNSTGSETAISERLSDIPQSTEIEEDECASDPQGEHIYEHDAGADEVKFLCSPETCETSEVPKSTAELSQNGDQTFPDHNMDGEPKRSVIPEDVSDSDITEATLAPPADQDVFLLGCDEDCEESAADHSTTKLSSGRHHLFLP